MNKRVIKRKRITKKREKVEYKCRTWKKKNNENRERVKMKNVALREKKIRHEQKKNRKK